MTWKVVCKVFCSEMLEINLTNVLVSTMLLEIFRNLFSTFLVSHYFLNIFPLLARSHRIEWVPISNWIVVPTFFSFISSNNITNIYFSRPLHQIYWILSRICTACSFKALHIDNGVQNKGVVRLYVSIPYPALNCDLLQQLCRSPLSYWHCVIVLGGGSGIYFVRYVFVGHSWMFGILMPVILLLLGNMYAACLVGVVFASVTIEHEHGVLCSFLYLFPSLALFLGFSSLSSILDLFPVNGM